MSDTHMTVMATVAPVEVPERMHPLVKLGMASGIADPAALREMLALQREWEAGEAKKAFTRALAALKRDLPTVIKKDATVDYTSDRTNKRTTYKHASLAGVMNEITEPLTKHGFSLSWTPATTERLVKVTCRLTHAEGHHEECTLDAPADTSGQKSPAQGIASTITLLQRYSALALLGIATADMKEPQPEERDTSAEINADRNLNAVAKLARVGVRREVAEAHLGGKLVAQWTGADIETLKTDLAALKAKSKRPEPAPAE